MRVLVTGATGFVGHHAVRALVARGHDVHATATRRPADDGGAAWHAADLLRDGDAARVLHDVRPTHLLHLAWFVRPGAFWRAPENLDWVGASLGLLRAFAEQGGTRAVLAGTSAEYAWGDGRCAEDATRLAPSTLYGAAKHALRLVAEPYAADAGVSLAWGRLFFLYGPREAPGRLVSSVARALLLGEPAATSDGRQQRDFLHVADAGDAFAALLESAVTGPVNVASGDPVAVRDVVAALAEEVGRPELVRWGAVQTAAGDPPLVVADVRRLTDEVGWHPRVGLREGLRDTLDWWRGELHVRARPSSPE